MRMRMMCMSMCTFVNMGLICQYLCVNWLLYVYVYIYDVCMCVCMCMQYVCVWVVHVYVYVLVCGYKYVYVYVYVFVLYVHMYICLANSHPQLSSCQNMSSPEEARRYVEEQGVGDARAEGKRDGEGEEESGKGLLQSIPWVHTTPRSTQGGSEA
ncbi:hypothetical protein EON63_17240 [archaeon]|nr:MAG: hypothetical protein EON63_17240 [archaeon]